MNTRATASNLAQAAKDLSIAWQRTKESWHDVKSAEFESKFLEPMPGYIARTAAAIEELDGILRKVKSDCE